MKKILIFSLESWLFKNSAYHPLDDLDFFQLRQNDYLLGLYGPIGSIQEKTTKLRLNLNVFFWIKEGRTDVNLNDFLVRLEKMAKIDKSSFKASDIILFSSNLDDLTIARQLGLKFVAVCFNQEEAKIFLDQGLSPSEIIIKDLLRVRIGDDIKFFLS